MFDEKLFIEPQIHPEDEARKILSSLAQDKIEFYNKSTALLIQENKILQKKIDEVSQLNREMEQKYEELFMKKIPEPLDRNNMLIRVERGIKTASEWTNELIYSVNEEEETSKDLEQAVAELQTLMIQFKVNSTEEFIDIKHSLETDIKNHSEVLEEANAAKTSFNFEAKKVLMEINEKIRSLEIVLSEIKKKSLKY